MGHAFRFSAIVDHFKYTPEQVAELTDYQINKVLFHKRDRKTGELEAPARPERAPRKRRGKAEQIEVPRRTRKDDYFDGYQALFNALQNQMISPDNFRESVKKLQEKYADVFEPAPAPRAEPEPVVESNTRQDEVLLLKYKLDGLLSEEQYQEALKRLRQG